MDYKQFQKRKTVLKNYKPLNLAKKLVEIINQDLN